MNTAESNWRDRIIEAFREHRGAVYGVARRYCDDEAAADVTQEVFLRVWNNRVGFDEARGNIRQYLCTIARGTAIDHLRRKSSQQGRDTRHATTTAHVGIDPNLAARLIDAEAAGRVQQALAQLHTGERRAIVMAFFGEMSYREVAIRLGVAEGTAKSRIRSGLAKLRDDLSSDWVGGLAGGLSGEEFGPRLSLAPAIPRAAASRAAAPRAAAPQSAAG
ncbi:MAG: sigma-70 family RNA polymerase sigma factor [Ilumatobacteraceae bacterium]